MKRLDDGRKVYEKNNLQFMSMGIHMKKKDEKIEMEIDWGSGNVIFGNGEKFNFKKTKNYTDKEKEMEQRFITELFRDKTEDNMKEGEKHIKSLGYDPKDKYWSLKHMIKCYRKEGWSEEKILSYFKERGFEKEEINEFFKQEETKER